MTLDRAEGRRLVVFGASNLLCDLFDCAGALGILPGKVVLNAPFVERTRTRSLDELLQSLPLPPAVIPLDAFHPAADELYLLGTTARGREHLVSEVTSRFAIHFTTLVHPRAVVSGMARAGEGVFVGAGSVVAPGVVLGSHVFINRGVTIGHHTQVGDFSTLSPGVNVGGHVAVGRGVAIGMGACVLEELVIGDHATVGAASLVTKDVPPGQTALGSPARLRSSPASQQVRRMCVPRTCAAVPQ